MSNLDSLAVSNYGYNFGMNPMSMQNYGYYNLYADPSWQNYWQWSQQMDTINAQNQALTLNNNPAQNTNNLTFGQNPTITNTNTTNPTTSAQPEKRKVKARLFY